VHPIDEHRVSEFCCYRVTKYPEYQAEPFVYSRPEAMTTFYDHIMHEAEYINSIVEDDEEMLPTTSTQRKAYDEATHCGNCGGKFPGTTSSHAVITVTCSSNP